MTIEKLYADFCLIDPHSNDSVRHFYQQNSVLLRSINEFQNEDQLRMFLEMTWLSIKKMVGAGRYNEAIDHSNTFLPVIERSFQTLNLSENDGYRAILFQTAVASFYLRDYASSTEIFANLKLADPSNDLFSLWHEHSVIKKKLWLFGRIDIVLCVILGICFF